jgi:hypothetical protein
LSKVSALASEPVFTSPRRDQISQALVWGGWLALIVSAGGFAAFYGRVDEWYLANRGEKQLAGLFLAGLMILAGFLVVVVMQIGALVIGCICRRYWSGRALVVAVILCWVTAGIYFALTVARIKESIRKESDTRMAEYQRRNVEEKQQKKRDADNAARRKGFEDHLTKELSAQFDAHLTRAGWKTRIIHGWVYAEKDRRSISIGPHFGSGDLEAHSHQLQNGVVGMVYHRSAVVPANWPADAPIPDFCEVYAVWMRHPGRANEKTPKALIHMRWKKYSTGSSPERPAVRVVAYLR